jgi:hypothetical protein
MKRFTVYSGYSQFYVADVGLEPEAPVDWTDLHVEQRHNTLTHITALCPEGDITARIISYGPGDDLPLLDDPAEFEVVTEITVTSGQVGVYGWPWELEDVYSVEPGVYTVIFRGFRL